MCGKVPDKDDHRDLIEQQYAVLLYTVFIRLKFEQEHTCQIEDELERVGDQDRKNGQDRSENDVVPQIDLPLHTGILARIIWIET